MTSAHTRDTAFFVGLIGAVSLTACLMACLGRASWLEAGSFVTGAVCVWLTVKQNIWNFPVGLVNVATYCVVFFQSRLFADAGLQIVYFILGLVGWYLWLRGDELRSELRIARASRLELSVLLLCIAAGTLGLWQTLHRVGG